MLTHYQGNCNHEAIVHRRKAIFRKVLRALELKLTRKGVEDLAQPLQGTDVAVARGRFAKPENLGGLGVGEILEMPKRQDFAVDRLHAVEDRLKADLHLGAKRGLAGGGHPAKQLIGQGSRTCMRIRAAMQRDLAAGVAQLSPEVAAVNLGKLLSGQKAEPEKRGHLGVGKIGISALGDIDERLLQDIRRVDASQKTAIQPKPDHPPEPLAMLNEQRRQARQVGRRTCVGLLAQIVRLVRHRGSHEMVTADRDRSSTSPTIFLGNGISQAILHQFHHARQKDAVDRIHSPARLGKSNLNIQIWNPRGVRDMGRPPSRDLTERELEGMHSCWREGEANAAEARDRLAASGLDRTYTTVANLVRGLADKGFLRQVNDERPFRYVALRSHEEVSKRLLGDMLDRVFRGSRAQLLKQLVDERTLTNEERELIEQVLKKGQTQ